MCTHLQLPPATATMPSAAAPDVPPARLQTAACLCALAATPAAAARQPTPPAPAAKGKQHHTHHKMQPGDTKGMKFWEHATFDPWAVAHSGTVPPEYLGMSKAEEHWIAPEEWFDRRNLTERIMHIFPLIDMNNNGFVELKELERWHHVNKVFVEKARAKESLVRIPQRGCLPVAALMSERR